MADELRIREKWLEPRFRGSELPARQFQQRQSSVSGGIGGVQGKRAIGVTVTLLFMPVLSLFGFAAMGLVPVLTVLAVFQVARRASTFAFMRPAREVLFTVLRREDKYKAKSFIDTFGYRCGDQIGAWSYKGLQELGLGLSAISYIAVPVVAGWCALGLWLGRKQRALAEPQQGSAAMQPGEIARP